jgi:hypothetical protein
MAIWRRVSQVFGLSSLCLSSVKFLHPLPARSGGEFAFLLVVGECKALLYEAWKDRAGAWSEQRICKTLVDRCRYYVSVFWERDELPRFKSLLGGGNVLVQVSPGPPAAYKFLLSFF